MAIPYLSYKAAVRFFSGTEGRAERLFSRGATQAVTVCPDATWVTSAGADTITTSEAIEFGDVYTARLVMVLASGPITVTATSDGNSADFTADKHHRDGQALWFATCSITALTIAPETSGTSTDIRWWLIGDETVPG